jgi:hypothetical protein
MSSIDIISYTCTRAALPRGSQSIILLTHFMLRTKFVVKHLPFLFLFAV